MDKKTLKTLGIGILLFVNALIGLFFVAGAIAHTYDMTCGSCDEPIMLLLSSWFVHEGDRPLLAASGYVLAAASVMGMVALGLSLVSDKRQDQDRS